MDVREFVRDAIVQVVHGVNDAQAAVVSITGAAVNPPGLFGSKVPSPLVNVEGVGASVSVLDFDLAVVVKEDATSGAHIGVVGGFFGVGGSGSQANATEASSRLRFSVPVLLPSQKVVGAQRV